MGDAPTIPPARLRVADVAHRWDVSTAHIYNLINRGELPAFTVGGSIRIKPEDVEEYERQCRVTPSSRPSASSCEEPGTISNGGRVADLSGYRAGQKIGKRLKGSAPASSPAAAAPSHRKNRQ